MEGQETMYDIDLTKMSLPSEHYRILLGTALSVFSSNNGFMIENILSTDNTYSWYDLIDTESGRLKPIIEKTISLKTGKTIFEKYAEIVERYNRIIHGFRITSSDNEQIMATKVKGSGEQFLITDDYLIEFIRLNDELSEMLYVYRVY